MERSPSADAFAQDPIGQWFLPSPTTLVFCVTPELAGAITWGRPSKDDVERMLDTFLLYRSPHLAKRIDVVLDGSAVEGVDPDSLSFLIEWLRERREELTDRIRLQYGVISDNVVGVLLSGILPVLGETHAFRVVRNRRDAFRALSPDGDAICDRLDAVVAAARGMPRELRDLRAHLRSTPSAVTLEECAKALAVSARSLQRALSESGTTFRDELQEARFANVEDRLRNSTEKIATIAERVGLSENALAQLVRKKTGTTPAELRRRHRGTG